MAENVMENVTGIEMGSLVIDDSTPTNCIMIQTRRNKYCFRLSETFPVEKQYEMFRQFVVDVNTPIPTASVQESPVETPAEAPAEAPAEKHDGAPLFDKTIEPPTNVEITTQN